MLKSNAPEILREEILAQARRESEVIVRRAQEEAEALLAKAAGEADKLRRDRLERARAEAARRRELILGTVRVETDRLRSLRVEAVLESVCEEVRRRLATREGIEYREAIVVLAAEAVGQMVGEAFIVRIPPADGSGFGQGLAEEIAQRVGRSPLRVTISEDPTVTGGGVVVQDLEGHQVCDNRFGARLERLWPELRRQIAMQTEFAVRSEPAGVVT